MARTHGPQQPLNESTNGAPFPASTSGTLLHTVTSEDDAKEVVWIHATNDTGSDISAFLEIGSPTGKVPFSITTGDSNVLVYEGFVLASGVTIKHVSPGGEELLYSGAIMPIGPDV